MQEMTRRILDVKYDEWILNKIISIIAPLISHTFVITPREPWVILFNPRV